MVRGSRAIAATGALALALVPSAWERLNPRTEPAYFPAERALDRGDVEEARDIAERLMAEDRSSWAPGLPSDRDEALRALSIVRDRDAAPAEVEEARTVLRRRAERRNNLDADDVAAVGEAAERAGDDAEALRILVPLADEYLLRRGRGAWTQAALGRALRRRGDESGAEVAFSRCRAGCRVEGVDQRVCDGAMPKPHHLRIRRLGYALPLIILGAASLRRHQARATSPWRAYRAALFHALGLVAAAVIALLLGGRHPWAAAGLAIFVANEIGRLQGRAFVAAVCRGTVPGFVLRDPVPSDAALARVDLPFGPPTEQTLEIEEPGQSYRETARVPLLRLGQQARRGHSRWLVVGASLAGILAAAIVALVWNG